ncbi:MAG: hypothetical protein HWE22_04940 [Flavobacteriales bacterium]|nr:hypothetical protein [Flavobacteriales bacterium]
MKSLSLILFSIISYCSIGQVRVGSIEFSGRVTHMYDAENYQIEIPFERQNTQGVLGKIYFDSTHLEIDFLATIAYNLNVTYKKEKEWVLYLERFGSNKKAKTVLYEDLEVFIFDSLSFNFDTIKVIASYPCHLATYELAGIPYEAWFCTDIELGGNLLPIPTEIAGTCLEFTLPMDIADVKYTATTVNSTPPKPERFEMVLPHAYVLEGEPLFPVTEPTRKEPSERTSLPPIPPPPPPMRVEED